MHYSEQTPPIGNTSITHEPEVHSFRKVVPSHMDHLDYFKNKMILFIFFCTQNNTFSVCNLASVCKISKNLIGQMTSSSTSLDLMGGGIEL